MRAESYAGSQGRDIDPYAVMEVGRWYGQAALGMEWGVPSALRQKLNRLIRIGRAERRIVPGEGPEYRLTSERPRAYTVRVWPTVQEALTEDWQTSADIAWECGVSVTSARDALEKHRPMAARRTGRDGTVWWRLPVGEDPPVPDGSVGHRLAAYLRDTGGGTVSAIASAIGAEPRRLAGVAKRLRCAEIVDVGGVLWIVQAGREDVLPSSMLRALLSDGRPHTTQEAREATGLTGYPVYVALKEAGAVCDHLGKTWTLADGKRWARCSCPRGYGSCWTGAS